MNERLIFVIYKIIGILFRLKKLSLKNGLRQWKTIAR